MKETNCKNWELGVKKKEEIKTTLSYKTLSSSNMETKA